MSSAEIKLTKLLYRPAEVEHLLSFGRTKIAELVECGELEAHCENGVRMKPTRITARSIIAYYQKHIMSTDDFRAGRGTVRDN